MSLIFLRWRDGPNGVRVAVFEEGSHHVEFSREELLTALGTLQSGDVRHQVEIALQRS